MKEKPTVIVGSRVTRSTHKKMLEFLEESTYLNVSDYIRDLIRRDLDAWETKEE